jgi:hypothetical protein
MGLGGRVFSSITITSNAVSPVFSARWGGRSFVLHIASQIVLVVENFTLIEADRAIRKNVKALRWIVLAQHGRESFLPWMNPRRYPRRDHCAVVK